MNWRYDFLLSTQCDTGNNLIAFTAISEFQKRHSNASVEEDDTQPSIRISEGQPVNSCSGCKFLWYHRFGSTKRIILNSFGALISADEVIQHLRQQQILRKHQQLNREHSQNYTIFTIVFNLKLRQLVWRLRSNVCDSKRWMTQFIVLFIHKIFPYWLRIYSLIWTWNVFDLWFCSFYFPYLNLVVLSL